MTRAKNGEPEQFFQQLLNSDAEDCVLWPFAKAHGYGIMQLPDKTVGLVHARVCRAVNGSPENSEHIALHSCHQGHLGCCNPKHLYWGSRSQNMADAIEAGQARGLTEDKRNRAKAFSALGWSYNRIADELGVSAAAVGTFLRGETFSA